MIMGGTTSGLQTVQAKIGNMRDATATTQESSPPTTAIGDAASVGMALPPKTKEELPVYAGEAMWNYPNLSQKRVVEDGVAF
jgi:hypothetical protein